MSETIIYSQNITAAEAAHRTGLDLDDILELIRGGSLFGMTMNKKWYVSEAAIPVIRHIVRRRRQRAERERVTA